jgi:KDO2-lipid IV(A) lauroyltransferase
MDYPLYILVRGLIAALNFLPLPIRMKVMTQIVRLATLLLPKVRKTARRNLELAFPSYAPHERERLLSKSYQDLARLIVDFARLGELDAKWVAEHVSCPFLPRFREIKAENPGKGIVIATGHLGSFELLAHCVAMYGHPISFVVRLFELKRINEWWTAIRERYGNRVISREGAFKHIMSELQRGRDVGILFDQNVKRNHAVFVDWFGRPAATTKSVALAALRTEAPVVVAGVVYRGDGKYEILAEECNFKAIYADSSLSADEKVVRITQDVSNRYIQFIKESPSEWFWVHRRWKTTPEGVTEKFYV